MKAAAVAGSIVLASCGAPEDSLSVSGPTTASASLVDLPSEPVSQSAATVEARLRAAGVGVTAIDRENGFILARTSDPSFVDCGEISEVVNGTRQTYPGNAPRLVLSDLSGGTRVRTLSVDTSAGIGITEGVTNSVVIRQEHRVTLTIQSGGETTLLETREFTERGFARFADGTTCRSSDAMNRAVQ